MRTLGYMVVVLALTAVAANAAIVTDPNLGAKALKLKVLADGTATITNVTAANVLIDSYEIWSTANKLDPTDDTGWISIEDYWNGDHNMYNMTYVKGKLGSGSMYFAQVGTVSAHMLSELNGTTGKGGTFKASDPFSLGKPVLTPVPKADDLLFYYTLVGNTGNKFLGLVEVIPEPATLLLVAGGAAVFMLRRRRT